LTPKVSKLWAHVFYVWHTKLTQSGCSMVDSVKLDKLWIYYWFSGLGYWVNV